MRRFVCTDPKCNYQQRTDVKGHVEFTHRHGKSTKTHKLKEIK